MQIPKPIYDLSRNMKIIRYEQLLVGDPWESITGKLEIGRKISIEELLEERGFEDVGQCF